MEEDMMKKEESLPIPPRRRLDEESLDHLTSLCQRCGLLSPSADNRGESTSSDDRPRQVLRRQYTLWRRHVQSVYDTGDDAAWLVEHEALAQALREALRSFYQWVAHENRAVAQELRALEELVCQTSDDPWNVREWFLWIQNVVHRWQQNVWAEQVAWRDWQRDVFEHTYDTIIRPEGLSPKMRLPHVASVPQDHSNFMDKVMVERLMELLQEVDSTASRGIDQHDSFSSNITIMQKVQETTDQVAEENKSTITRNNVSTNEKLLLPQHDGILESVQEYFAAASSAPTAFYVLHGPSGTGKSFTCQQLQERIHIMYPDVRIFNPRVPLDFLGRTVGGAEGTWLNLLESIRAAKAPFLILIDSMDEFVPDEDVLGGTLKNRLASGWLYFLDSILTASPPFRGLIVGTCTKVSGTTHRLADRTFVCESPSSAARERFFCNVAGIPPEGVGQPVPETVKSLVTLSLGKSYGEMVSISHKVLSNLSESLSSDEIVSGLMDQFHKNCPPSLLTGVEGLVDVRIMSASDLGATSSTLDKPGNLNGSDVILAWQRLQMELIIPLCRSRDLQSLLGSGNESKKTVGGVLLSGPPACGKTTLAYEAARFATSLDPRVKLVSVSCTSIVHKEVGGSEKALHQLFLVVRQAAPCIVLLEGIETIAAVRGNDNTTEGTMDRLLSTLLIELDGVESQSDKSFAPFAVIGTTQNHKWVDPALKRPGRLGAVIPLELHR